MMREIMLVSTTTNCLGNNEINMEDANDGDDGTSEGNIDGVGNNVGVDDDDDDSTVVTTPGRYDIY